MTIIHGDNTIKSRQALIELLSQHKIKGREVVTISARSLTPAQLEQSIGGQSLFGTQKVVVVEELHSQADSAKRKQLVAQLAESSAEIILWEKRLLTATMLKKLGKAQVETFKASSILFSWLDGLGQKGAVKNQLVQLKDICAQESAQFCFSMMCRQIRLLIAAKDDGQVKGAPFIVSKLKRQAQHFTLPKLLQLHSRLLQIEFAQKRALSKLSMEQQLDLFVLDL